MKLKIICGILLILIIVANVSAILNGNANLEHLLEVLFIIPLLGFYYRKIRFKNINFLGFLGCYIIATFISFFNEIWYFRQVKLLFLIIAVIFLVKEALKFTRYSKGSKIIMFYFFLVVGVYLYLLSLHVLEIAGNMDNKSAIFIYVIYYLNLIILAVTALVYYLNSFSQKSVFFICLSLSFIFSDILRDMGVFYFRDPSVEIIGSLINFAAVKFVLLFFVTKEKKLRLLNLI